MWNLETHRNLRVGPMVMIVAVVLAAFSVIGASRATPLHIGEEIPQRSVAVRPVSDTVTSPAASYTVPVGPAHG